MNLGSLTVLAMAVLCFLLIGLQPVLGSTVGPVYLSDGVTVFSPVNTTYNTKNILFNYTVAVGIGSHLSLNYTLDDALTAPMPFFVINPRELHVVSLARGQVQLPELSEGLHTLTISMHTDFIFSNAHSYVDTIHFTVDSAAPDVVLDATPPSITIQTPQRNQTYAGAVPLNVLLSEKTTPFTVTIDGNRTFTLPVQNTTLNDLTVGEHSLSIEANDLVGNHGYSNYVTFYVSEPTPTPMPTATSIEPTKPPQQPPDNRFLAVFAVGGLIAGLALTYFAVKKLK
jgi:hypothetical protein